MEEDSIVIQQKAGQKRRLPGQGGRTEALEPPDVIHRQGMPRARAEGSAEYKDASEGTLRNNGGCWTCLFRKTACTGGIPSCHTCLQLGLVCEYGRPRWWHDENLREAQKKINNNILSDHKKTLKLSEKRSTRPKPAQRTNTFVPVNVDSSRRSENQQSADNRSMQPPPKSRPTLLQVLQAKQNQRRQAESTSNRPPNLNNENDFNDLYDVSPPPPVGFPYSQVPFDTTRAQVHGSPLDVQTPGPPEYLNDTHNQNFGRSEEQRRFRRSGTARSL